MFSPILAMVCEIASSTVREPTLVALIFSTSVPAGFLRRQSTCLGRAAAKARMDAGSADEGWLFCRQLFRLGDPAFHAAGESNLLADLVGGVGTKSCDLPVVEDAEVVKLFLD